jgi:hypothetical protein
MILGEKPVVLLAYVTLGIGLACVLPLMRRMHLFELSAPSSHVSLPFKGKKSILITLAVVLLLALALSTSWKFVLCSAIASFFLAHFSVHYEGRMQRFIAIWLGLLFSTLLPWWMRDSSNQLNISSLQVICVITLTAITYAMLAYQSKPNNNIMQDQCLRWLIYAIFSALAVVLVMSTGVALTAPDSIFWYWHHWGAYIGPAQLVAAGAVPLQDIPVQYGLGPTILLMKGCASSCWLAVYWISGLTTLGMVAILAWLALRMNRSNHPLSIIATLIIILTSSLLWTSFPPALNPPLSTPSTTGLRFLPGLLMLAWLVRGIYSNSKVKYREYIGHIIWLLCILWAPESAIHASAIWIPYFVWSNTFKGESSTYRKKSQRFVRSLSILMLVLLVGLLGFSGIFNLIFGDWPLPSEYIAYIMYPPGPMPINWGGTVWFAIATFVSCFVIWWCYANAMPETKTMQVSWLVSLHCFATFTYYLGRSHDNNILNLLPYLILLLFATKGLPPVGRPVQALLTVLLASIIGWVSVFGTTNYLSAIKRHQILNFAPSELVAKFNRESSGSEDLIRALKHIRSVYHEPIEIFDAQMLLDGFESQPPWSALHGPANYPFFPLDKLTTYVQRVARRLHKPGWVLYEKNLDMSANMLAYDSIYVRTEELDFGSYKAIRFIPK